MEEKNKTFMCSLDEQQCQQECEHKYDRTFCQFATLIEPQSPAPQSVEKEMIAKMQKCLIDTGGYMTHPRGKGKDRHEFIEKREDELYAAMKSYSSELRKENEEVKRLLHDLTPGGSEFYNDPKYCAEWIRKSREENHYALVGQIKGLKNQLTNLQSTNEELRNERDAFEYNANQYSNQLDELRKENERLKTWCNVLYEDGAKSKLLLKGVKYINYMERQEIEKGWQQFKADNNL